MSRNKTMLPPNISLTPRYIDVGNTSTRIINSNSQRRYLIIQNVSNEAVWINFGESAVASESIQLPGTDSSSYAQGSYEMSIGQGNIFTGFVEAICASGSKRIIVLEGHASGFQSSPVVGATAGISSSSSSESSSSSSSSSSSTEAQNSSSSSSSTVSSSSSSSST